MQDIYMSIGQSIRRRRKEKHLTQETLATNVETSAQYISRIERGQVCPSLEFLYRLSAALECPIYSLLPSTAPSASTSFFSFAMMLLLFCIIKPPERSIPPYRDRFSRRYHPCSYMQCYIYTLNSPLTQALRCASTAKRRSHKAPRQVREPVTRDLSA